MKAKFIYESIKDVLKPKSKEDIKQAIIKKYDYLQLKRELDDLPSLQEFLKNFYIKPRLWLDDPKWIKRKNEASHVQQNIDGFYGFLDITEETKSKIYDTVKEISSKKPLKVLSYTPIFASNYKYLFTFLFNLRFIINENKEEIFGDNDAYRWIYSGNDYSHFANSDGSGLFIIPEDFLDKFFNV